MSIKCFFSGFHGLQTMLWFNWKRIFSIQFFLERYLQFFNVLYITCIMTWHENEMYDGGLTSQYIVSVVRLTIGQDEIEITKQRFYIWGMQISMCNIYLPRYRHSTCSVSYIYRNAHLSSGGSYCKGLTLPYFAQTSHFLTSFRCQQSFQLFEVISTSVSFLEVQDA